MGVRRLERCQSDWILRPLLTKSHSPESPMLTVASLAALFGASAFQAPAASLAASPRTMAPAMSHFSCVKTELRNKKALVQSLEDLGMEVQVAAEGAKELVSGYQGQTHEAELKIAQQNGHDIGFSYNGNSYELVSELQFWQQDVSVDRFIEKLSVQYAVNSIKEVSNNGGFSLQQQVNEQDGTIAMTLSRWN